jgi:UDPglucose--hexose-1-phosphate uridylyltransferase
MKTISPSSDHPHRRYNSLTGEWVLVSPQRTKRPWLGKVESAPAETRPQYDPTCYLCPGNERANGIRNPKYESTYVFDNDFSALLPVSVGEETSKDKLIKRESVQGVCKVVCFSPRHDLTLPQMSEKEIRNVIDVWADQMSQLGAEYRWVQIFENKGEIMGCSNPHPHCQIWASTSIPNEPSKEDAAQRAYLKQQKNTLLQDYLRIERKAGERVVMENDHWTVVVPFWAVWPFETLLLPKRHILRLSDVKKAERDTLAVILKMLLTRYDNLFNVSFPYTMGWHSAPFRKKDYSYWQLHAHFYPPLLRSATVKKFMVGYEMLSEPQRDITPEQAAERLKNTSDVHYTLQGQQRS